MIYLYAITEKLDRPLEALRGLDCAPLAYLRHNGLGAVVSVVETPTVAPTPRRLWQHEQVVEALMTRTTVVPARFSTVFADEATVLGTLADLHEQLEGDLERVRGCVELGLRVLRVAEPPCGEAEKDGLPCPDLLASEKNGHTFEIARRAAVLQREAMRRRDESLGEMLDRVLRDLSVDHVAEVEQGGGILMKASYLVEQRRLREMQQAVYRLMKTHRHLHFLCTGPWPPYHFVRPIEPEPVG